MTSSNLTELQLHNKNLGDILDTVEKLIKDIGSMPKVHRKETLDTIASELTRAQRIIKLFAIEVRTVAPSERALFKSKLKDHEKRHSDLNSEFTWLKNEDVKGDLKGIQKIETAKDIRQLDSSQAQDYARGLQQDSLDSIDRTLTSIDDSTKVGTETATQLKAQTEQLGRIYDELYDIDDMLERSTKIIQKMLRTTGSDKVVWCFAFLVLVAIIIAIIVTKSGPTNFFTNKAST